MSAGGHPVEAAPSRRLSLDDLRSAADSGQIDTVELAAVDMQGRLQGRRLDAHFFLDRVAAQGQECQSYILATDAEMNTPDGYTVASWQTGYGNLVLRPDLTTLRRAPWHERSALVLSDLSWRDGGPVTVSPRQVLRHQLDRLDELGLTAVLGAELEFLLLATSYREAWGRGYRDLEPAGHFGDDFALLDTDTDGRFHRRLVDALTEADVPFEAIMSEANVGQHEVVLQHGPALAACDRHIIARFAVKQVAASCGMSATFMPKFNEREGNACHLHFSLVGRDGQPAFGDEGGRFSPLFENFLAGQLAYLREFTLLFAPNINSYKRYVAGSYAPTRIAWGWDNRTCALRVLGRGASLRFEHRVPGADANPYLAAAALIGAGLMGVEGALPLEAACEGNAYADTTTPVIPDSLGEALSQFRDSAAAQKVFGSDVVEHYSRAAEVELAAFAHAITDWERVRGFERL